MSYGPVADLIVRSGQFRFPVGHLPLDLLRLLYRPDPCESCGTAVSAADSVIDPEGRQTDMRGLVEIAEPPDLGTWHTPERCRRVPPGHAGRDRAVVARHPGRASAAEAWRGPSADSRRERSGRGGASRPGTRPVTAASDPAGRLRG